MQQLRKKMIDPYLQKLQQAGKSITHKNQHFIWIASSKWVVVICKNVILFDFWQCKYQAKSYLSRYCIPCKSKSCVIAGTLSCSKSRVIAGILSCFATVSFRHRPKLCSFSPVNGDIFKLFQNLERHGNSILYNQSMNIEYNDQYSYSYMYKPRTVSHLKDTCINPFST